MSELQDRLRKALKAARASTEEALINGQIPIDQYNYTMGVLKGFGLAEDAIIEELKDPDRD